MTSFKQKISAMLVLSLFLLSVLPAGIADEGKNRVDVDVNAEVKRGVDGDDVEIKTKVETEDNDSEEKVEIKTEVKDGLLRKEVKREVKVLKNSRERFEEDKERFKDAKDEQREHRQKVLDLNKVVKRCNPEKEDCAALKAELRLGVKNHLEKSAQVVERSLEKLRHRLDGMEDLPQDEKDAAVALIDGLDLELQALKEKIGSFTAETSKEEIRAATKELKELNQKVNKLQRRMVGLLVNAKLQTLVGKHLELHDSMQARIDALAAKGIDVSELEDILAEFDAKVEELQADYDAAAKVWKDGSAAADFDRFNLELRQAQHEVRKDLQETKKILRNFTAKYREIQRSVEGKNETEEEESEEASEESGRDKTESNTALEANASAEATV